jgi:hypothetical protein
MFMPTLTATELLKKVDTLTFKKKKKKKKWEGEWVDWSEKPYRVKLDGGRLIVITEVTVDDGEDDYEFQREVVLRADERVQNFLKKIEFKSAHIKTFKKHLHIASRYDKLRALID